MRFYHPLFILFLVSLTACSTTKSDEKMDASEREPETMLVTYYVKPGKEAEFQKVLAQAWETFRREKMVFAKPHLVVRDHEDAGTTRFVESFTWVTHHAPDHAPDSVKAIWKQEQSLCEARAGHKGIEGSEVDSIVPTLR
jgi:quinol monooxygenase YgiN